MHSLNGTAGESVSIESLLRDRRKQTERIAALEADYKQLDVLYGEEFNRNNVLVGERAALRQQLLVAQADVKRLREAGKRCRKEMERRGLLGEANFILREMDISSDTSAIDSLQRGAEFWQYVRKHRDVLLLTGFFGNGCINKTIEDVESTILAAIGASHEHE